jgi:hypothetical protein
MTLLRVRSIRHLPILLLPLALAACKGLLGTSDRNPREARVVVTGSSAVPLRLVTSTNFTATLNPETGNYDVSFTTFDAQDLPLPIERTVRLTTDRFIARLVNPSEEVEATVLMEVFFDGRLAYRQEATMRDALLDFIHIFF